MINNNNFITLPVIQISKVLQWLVKTDIEWSVTKGQRTSKSLAKQKRTYSWIEHPNECRQNTVCRVLSQMQRSCMTSTAHEVRHWSFPHQWPFTNKVQMSVILMDGGAGLLCLHKQMDVHAFPPDSTTSTVHIYTEVKNALRSPLV